MLKFLKNIVPFAAAAGCLLLAGGCSRTMYPQGQHRRDLPPTDAVLCYGGSHHRTPFLWDKERLAPYVTYVDKEGTEQWLFDGFIFREQPPAKSRHPAAAANGTIFFRNLSIVVGKS